LSSGEAFIPSHYKHLYFFTVIIICRAALFASHEGDGAGINATVSLTPGWGCVIINLISYWS